ncbi:MAG: type II secretion system protein [Campylobacterales bacterium]|nr:type II secretion system protein [Campylobacterales bacterium]
MVNKFHMPSKATNALGVPSKSAFTLIELIFAIVIIGISMISLPMMTQAVSKGIEGNLVQEAIFAASAELNQVVSYHWDANSTENSNNLAKVVWTSPNDCNTTTKLRLGHVSQPLHRRCLDNNASAPTPTGSLGSDGILDDIDDTINTTAVTLFEGGSATTSKGYKKDYSSTTNVTYADFGATTAASKNMKKVTVTITDTSGNIVTLLNTYSANIGEIDYYKRSF